MTENLNLWLIPILPLIGAAINGLFGRRFSKPIVSAVALFFSGAAFALVLRVWSQFSSLPLPHYEFLAHWIRYGNFMVNFEFYLDQLTMLMLLVVTGVGFLIHIYSIGYMWEDASYYRFFSYLNLFMFFMLTLVLAGNYLQMFIGWEGVGLASYLLIGFWFTKDSAASAGKKAFIVNRIGDFGFLIALFLMVKHFGSLNFTEVFEKVGPLPVETVGVGLLTSIGLLLMLGRLRQVGADSSVRLVAGRHGRPDAGFRPDPCRNHGDGGRLHGFAISRHLRSCSHGTYGRRHHWNTDRLLCRDDWHRTNRYQESSRLLHGLATGLHVHGMRRGSVFRGHLSPDDACVLQRPALPRRGSVIHAVGGNQDMRYMGGLRKYIPITFWTMTVATLAIAGIFPFAGFFSKDEILWRAFQVNKVYWAIGLFSAFLTAFYMSRLWFMTFLGEYRGTNFKPPAIPTPTVRPCRRRSWTQPRFCGTSHGAHGHGEPHESPWVMTGAADDSRLSLAGRRIHPGSSISSSRFSPTAKPRQWRDRESRA